MWNTTFTILTLALAIPFALCAQGYSHTFEQRGVHDETVSQERSSLKRKSCVKPKRRPMMPIPKSQDDSTLTTLSVNDGAVEIPPVGMSTSDLDDYTPGSRSLSNSNPIDIPTLGFLSDISYSLASEIGSPSSKQSFQPLFTVFDDELLVSSSESVVDGGNFFISESSVRPLPSQDTLRNSLADGGWCILSIGLRSSREGFISDFDDTEEFSPLETVAEPFPEDPTVESTLETSVVGNSDNSSSSFIFDFEV